MTEDTGTQPDSNAGPHRRVSIEPGTRYAVRVGTRSLEVPSAEDAAKGGIAFFRFSGSGGHEHRSGVDGLTHTDKMGCFRYLPVSERHGHVGFSFVAPMDCDSVDITVLPRRVKSAIFDGLAIDNENPKSSQSSGGGEPAYRHRLSIEPGENYSVVIGTSATEAPSPEDAEKGGIATFTFFDANGDRYESRVRGLLYHENIGSFRYLPVFKHRNDARVRFVAPPDCSTVEIRIAPRRVRSATFEDVRIERTRTRRGHDSTRRGLPGAATAEKRSRLSATQNAEMADDIAEFLAQATQNPEQPFLIFSSGVRKIDDAHRANRSMVMAMEAARSGCNTILVYYRQTGEEDLPRQIHDKLLQVPKDIFHGLSTNIAAQVRNDRRYIIFSMPDVSAVSEVGVYDHFGWHTCYEARDDWEGFRDVGQAKWWTLEFERYVARSVDVAITVSAPLKSVVASLGVDDAKIHVIPNAAGRLFIDQSEKLIDSRAAAGPSAPVVGYFGHLTPAWFDWDLVLSAANQMPETRFEIVGHGAPNDILAPGNVRLLGPLAHNDIIAIARHWNTALVPFKGSRLARCVDPIKTYEYVAMGLKTLSYHMPQSEGLPLVSFYKDPSRFTDRLRDVLAYRPTREDYESCKLFSNTAGWSDRLRATVAVMDQAHR